MVARRLARDSVVTPSSRNQSERVLPHSEHPWLYISQSRLITSAMELVAMIIVGNLA